MSAITVAERTVPPMGGFNLTFLRLEIRRLLRNRRTVVFTLVMPVAFYFLFGGSSDKDTTGNGNVAAYVMISLAVYGAMLATTSGGATVSIERAAGWSRQLRLTPLRPAAYIAIKVLTAMVLGFLSVAIVFLVAGLNGARMPAHAWVESGLTAWIGALVFAAFGLFMGYLLPSENVMQILGPILALLAFFGGLFVPLDLLPHAIGVIATYTPVYGVGAIARSPLTGDGVTLAEVANIVVWTALFSFGATQLFRRDTKRV